MLLGSRKAESRKAGLSFFSLKIFNSPSLSTLDVREDEKLTGASICIKHAFRALLSCFRKAGLLSFSLKIFNSLSLSTFDVREDESLTGASIYIKHTFRALLSCFRKVGLLSAFGKQDYFALSTFFPYFSCFRYLYIWRHRKATSHVFSL